MPIQTKNPATGEVIATFEELTEAQLESKLALAESAYASWRKTTFAERSALMRKLGTFLREHKDEYGALQTLEMGKTAQSSAVSVEKCADLCDYYADNIEAMLGEESVAGGAKQQRVRFDPIGPVLAVMPWNYPFWQVYRFAIPAVMAGNVGLLKHASNVPQCAEAIERSFREAGFPEGVFQNLLLPSSRVEKVIRDRRVAAVTLTGSEKAGSEVARVAGEEIKKTVLELGGNDPFIVFEDADIEFAAETAVAARFLNNVGQSCISAKRFIVQHSVMDAFVASVKRRTEALVVGDPADMQTQIGPLATEQIMKDVELQVNASVAKGATIVTGGARREGAGCFYMPTVLTGIAKGMEAYDEEVFGPVISIIGFDAEEEAVRIANDTQYGLGSSLYTKDMDRARRLVSQIDAGNVFVNKMVGSEMHAPFGGVKRSGYGRELSIYGIREFVNIKNVWME